MLVLIYFLKALMIGVAIAAPVGPIGMLCIKKTLELGIKGAILVGLGAAIADGFYGMIAALGLQAVSNIFIENVSVLKLVGGFFLIYLAYKEVKSKGFSNKIVVKNDHSLKVIIEVFFLTVMNPMTILSFLGIFASISTGVASKLESMVMVFGIFLGSMIWWCFLGVTITKIKHKLSDSLLVKTKWISCLILLIFGLFAIFDVISVHNIF